MTAILKINLLLLLLIFAFGAKAQPSNYELNHFYSLGIETDLMKVDNYNHSSIRPYINGVNYDAATLNTLEETNYNYKIRTNLLARKLKQESLLQVDSGYFKFTIDPLFEFENGKDLKHTNQSYFVNTRGVMARGTLGKDVAFETTFLENQATFVNYLNDFVKEWGVVPGQGRVKPFKTTGFDYANATGYVSYSPSKHFNIQGGHGKLFVGNGYRSLLWSDNAFNFPYLKLLAKFGKFEYTATWASLQIIKDGAYSFNPLSEDLFRKKTATFQYLSYKPIRRLEIGLFQSVIWQAQGPENTKFNYNLLNPVIYAHAVQYGLGNINNVVVGWNANFKINSHINIYVQYMYDDKVTKKTGNQVGFKWYNILGIKNLHFQLENNMVTANTYSSVFDYQSYTQYNQAIAHPAGNNFTEQVIFINYRWHDFYTEIKLNHLKYKTDTLANFQAQNISNASLPNASLIASAVQYKDVKIGYVINHITNLHVAVGATFRDFKSDARTLQTNYVYISIGTALTNKYYDF